MKDEMIVSVHSALGSFMGEFLWNKKDIAPLKELNKISKYQFLTWPRYPSNTFKI